MKRTLLTTGLIAALLLAMTFPASAVSMETLPDSAPEAVEGITETAENQRAESPIDVEVPENVRYTLNPYRIDIEGTQDEVISAPQMIVSRTAAPLSVTVSAVGVAHGGASIAASPGALNPNGKSVFLWLEFHNVTDGQAITWSGEYTGTHNQVVLNGESCPVLELDASGDGNPVQAVFRIFGAAGVPSEGMWTVDDRVDVSLSFEFEVIEDDEATLQGVIFAEAVDDEEPSDVAEAVEDAEPFDIAEPVEDAEVFEAAEPVEEIGAPVEDEEPESGNAELSYMVPPVENVEASDVAELSDIAEAVEDAEPFDIAEPVEDAEVFEVAAPVEDTEASDVAEPVDDEEASGVAEPVEDAEASDVEEAVEDAELSDVAENVEDTEPSDVAEPVEDAEASDEARPVEDAEPSDFAEPVGNAEALK